MQLRARKPDPMAARQWMLLKDLVDRRAFSWTGLLARLEAVLPPDIKLVSISPDSKEGHLKLTVEAMSQSTDRAVELVKALVERPEFSAVSLKNLVAGPDGVACRYEMKYRPQPNPAAPPPPPEGNLPDDQESGADEGVDP